MLDLVRGIQLHGRLNFLIAGLCFCLTSSGVGLAAEPLLEKVEVFPAGMHGITLYRIPGIVVTTKGTVIAYCEARRDSRADWGEIEVHMRRSVDGCIDETDNQCQRLVCTDNPKPRQINEGGAEKCNEESITTRGLDLQDTYSWDLRKFDCKYRKRNQKRTNYEKENSTWPCPCHPFHQNFSLCIILNTPEGEPLGYVIANKIDNESARHYC